LKIFYIGSAGPLSLQPLSDLLGMGHDICGVGVGSRLSFSGQPSQALLAIQEVEAIDTFALAHHIPSVNLNRPITEVADEITSMKPDVLLVSCYERRVARSLLEIPSFGAFNIHPSILPAFRGPVPLFWQFRAGTGQFGLSLHRMTSHFDAGPVISSQSVQMPDGVTMVEATLQLTAQMKTLLNDGLRAIQERAVGVKQSESDASYQTFPAKADFEVSVEWPARRIFNFMRATGHMGKPYDCWFQGKKLRLKHALAYSDGGIPDCSTDVGQVIELACSSGTLTASYYH
jgi:methionyl-tRNA formyltransferase